MVGSISGGCVEGAVYELASQVIETGVPVLETYGVSDDDAFAVGLTCGGILDVFVERVDKEQFAELGEVGCCGAARRAGGGRDGDRGPGPDRRAPGDLGTDGAAGNGGGPATAAWARGTGWTPRWTTTPAACWPRG